MSSAAFLFGALRVNIPSGTELVVLMNWLNIYSYCFQNSLSETETSKADNEKELQLQITALQKQLDQLSKDKHTSEAKLTGDLDSLHKRLLGKTYT